MMESRLGYLLLGCVIGFILGYFARYLREIKEKVTEVDEHVTHQYRPPNDHGAAMNEWLMRVAMFFVVAVTSYAAFMSQRASNRVQDAQDSQKKATQCTEQFLAKTISALNERTTYTQAQASANIDLQKAQAQFLGLLFKQPPISERAGLAAAQRYYDALTSFIEVNTKSVVKVSQNPYPTNNELQNCITQR